MVHLMRLVACLVVIASLALLPAVGQYIMCTSPTAAPAEIDIYLHDVSSPILRVACSTWVTLPRVAPCCLGRTLPRLGVVTLHASL